MPAASTMQAEAERRSKISAALKGVPKGPRRPWNALLHSKCNLLLGLIENNRDLLTAAEKYLVHRTRGAL